MARSIDYSVGVGAVCNQNNGYFYDKLIKGVTGHRSEAINGYKRESDEQHVNVSKIVQGIRSGKGETTKSCISKDKPADRMGSIVLNISGGNCNVTIVKKSKWS